MKLNKHFVKQIVKTKQNFLIRAIQKILTFVELIEAKTKKSKIVFFLNRQYPELQVTLYDIGAAGGIESTYKKLLKLNDFTAIGFEPDATEVERLKQSSNLKLYPYAIAGNTEKKKFYITNFSHCSSLYPPNQKAIAEFPVADFFKVIDTREIAATSLGEFIKENHVKKPDFLKMDTQGAEYEILTGSPSIVENLTGISFETHLRELYEGQGLFHSIHEMLSKLDFRLIHLRSNQHFAGEILELNVAYVKNINHFSSTEQVLKAVLFCVCHENLNFAAHILRKSSLNNEQKSQLFKILSKSLNPPETQQLLFLKERAYQEGLFDCEML